MQEFVDDDRGYVEWVTKHPRGYVLNTERTPKANDLKLHRATCHTVTGVPARGPAAASSANLTPSISSSTLGQGAVSGLRGELVARAALAVRHSSPRAFWQMLRRMSRVSG